MRDKEDMGSSCETDQVRSGNREKISRPCLGGVLTLDLDEKDHLVQIFLNV